MLKVGRAVLVAFALVALVLAACERDEDDGAAGDGPSADSVLRVGNGGEVQFLDAAKSQSGTDIIFSEMIYNRPSPVRRDDDGPEAGHRRKLGSFG